MNSRHRLKAVPTWFDGFTAGARAVPPPPPKVNPSPGPSKAVADAKAKLDTGQAQILVSPKDRNRLQATPEL